MSREENGDYFIRRYRTHHRADDLTYFKIIIKESDLAIGADKASCTDSLKSLCYRELIRIRTDIEDYIKMQPEFKTALEPIKLLAVAPEVVKQMGKAAFAAGVGPMAAVAGVVSEFIGKTLDKYCSDLIVENGGDIYIKSNRERIIAVFAGKSQFTYRIGIKVQAGETPLGICTSSGTVGPSISLGRADAVVIKAHSATLADAVATAAANRVQSSDDLMQAVEFARKIDDVTGILAIKDDKMSAWGQIELIPLQGGNRDESSK